MPRPSRLCHTDEESRNSHPQGAYRAGPPWNSRSPVEGSWRSVGEEEFSPEFSKSKTQRSVKTQSKTLDKYGNDCLTGKPRHSPFFALRRVRVHACIAIFIQSSRAVRSLLFLTLQQNGKIEGSPICDADSFPSILSETIKFLPDKVVRRTASTKIAVNQLVFPFLHLTLPAEGLNPRWQPNTTLGSDRE